MHHVIYAEQSDFTKFYIVFDNEKRTECSINKDRFGADVKTLELSIIQIKQRN